MKKFFVLAAAASAAMFASPGQAAAADLDIGINLQTIGQLQLGPVTQQGASIAVAVGSVANNAAIKADVTNVVNAASIDNVLDMSNNGFLNGSLNIGAITQSVNSTVNQGGLSVAGSGNLGAASSITAGVTNVANAASMSTRVNMTH